MRICSLLPSATEIVYALGLDNQLVAVTHECDYPTEAALKPRITKSSISGAMTSLEIDSLVRQKLQTAGTLYELDVEMLMKLEPDIILTQELCSVCAISYESVCRIAAALPSKPQVLNLEPRSVDDILENIKHVGRLGGVEDRAEAFVAELRRRIARIHALTSMLEPKRVLCLEWLDPPFITGHWNPELVELAGGIDLLGRKYEPSKQVAWNQILSYNPDVLVVMCCGFSIDRTMRELDTLRSKPLKAVTTGKTFIVDGSAFFSRPGPRIIDSLEIVATILHPELFPFDYPSNIVQQIDVANSTMTL